MENEQASSPMRINPVYRETVLNEPLHQTPLGDQNALPLMPRPPRVIELMPESQRLAWEKTKGVVSDHRLIVLACIAAIGPATINEIAPELGWEKNKFSGRITELIGTGLISVVMDDSEEPKALLRDGCRQYVARPDWKQFIDEVGEYFKRAGEL